MNYLPFLLVMIWLGWSVVSSGTVHGADLPSERQCQALRTQQAVINTETEGWCLIITRSKGNCLACHDIDAKPLPEGLATAGNIAPRLPNISTSTRANVRANEESRLKYQIALRNIIYNAALKNPHTIMPLFGKHDILTETEIDRIVDFLMTL